MAAPKMCKAFLLNLEKVKAVITFAIKKIIGTYKSVLIRLHNYEDFSASWPTDDKWRVVDEFICLNLF